MLSIIIPSRQPEFLQQTIDGIFESAEGEVEVIAVLDGIWPDPPLRDDPRVRIIHQGTVHNNPGMRAAINAGMSIAIGEYVMKCDEHIMFDKGFDVKLKADCEDNWVVIPRRKRLLPDTWTIQEDGRPPVDYMHIDYPYQRPGDKTCGLHGAEWKQRHYDRQDVMIDDTPSMQGSCYFMTKKHWDEVIKDLDDVNYGTFTQEAQEVGFKTWFSGGRVVVNKRTWYAHYHKGKRGKGYGFSNEQYKKHMEGTEKGRIYCIEHWLYENDWQWFMEKFPDMPGWENWKERIEKDKAYDYSLRTDKKDWYSNNVKE